MSNALLQNRRSMADLVSSAQVSLLASALALNMPGVARGQVFTVPSNSSKQIAIKDRLYPPIDPNNLRGGSRYSSNHPARDYPALENEKIKSIADGVVLSNHRLSVNGANPYRNHLIVRSDLKTGKGPITLITMYCHASQAFADKDGQPLTTSSQISANTEIGLVGRTGRAAGTHLHLASFIVTKDLAGNLELKAVDPEKLCAGIIDTANATPYPKLKNKILPLLLAKSSA